MAHTRGLLFGGCGLFVALYAGWFIVSGPFFGYPVPPLHHVLIACGVFLVGTYVFAWGINANWQRHQSERPEISDKQDQTLDTGYGPR